MKHKKINLYNYILSFQNDKFGRRYLQSVYYDEGKKIATDTHVMCVIKSEFPENLNER